MRNVGEGGFGKLGQAQKAKAAYKKRRHKFTCHKCGYVTRLSDASLTAIGRRRGQNLVAGLQEWTCYECRKKEQRDVNRAILAIAARKAAKKKSR